MTLEQARNAIVAGLEAHIGRPVRLSEQIEDMPDYPYCYYSILAPRISEHALGLQELIEKDGEFIRRRSEPVIATMSFTFCSMNRETENGFVYGEDEALALCEKGLGFFLLNGHNIRTEFGDVVVNNVGAAANRTSFLVEDSVRRYGFDIRISFVRTDEMPTVTVERVNDPSGNAHS